MSRTITLKLNFIEAIKTTLIILIFMSYFCGFYLIPKISNSAIFILLYLILGLVYSKGKVKKNAYTMYVGVILGWFVIQSILTAVYYHEDTINIIRYNYYFLELLLFFVLNDYLNNSKKIEKTLDMFIVFELFYSVLLLLQSYMFSTRHIYIMHIQGMVSTKNGLPRFIGGLMVHSLFLVILVGLWCDKYFKNKIKSRIVLVTIIFGMLAQIFVIQTRMLEITIFTVLLINIWKYRSKYRIFDIIAKLIFVMLLAFVISFNIGLLDRFTITTSEVSFLARYGAIGHFVHYIIQNPIFGIGLITDSVSGVSQILHGPNGIFYASDCGLIGLIVRLGIIGGLWYCYSIYKVFGLLKRTKRYVNYFNSCFIFVLLSVLTNSLMAHYSIVVFPVMIVLGAKLIQYEEEGTKK